ncbi:MAG: archease [Candidatus Methanoperedens sp.]|nr:archease [Candidatus Methanoperedens sp.]MCZ7371961.1 archease [Candidatus Methanoperedens sp.]
MPFRYLEDIATSDVAFEAEGRNLEELFRDAAFAISEVMADTKSIKPAVSRKIELKNESIEGLLFDWLSELVYLKDAESILFGRFDVTIKKNDEYELYAIISGETIDREKHTLRSDVKAVTYHLYEVRKKGQNWIARVVLDI